MITINEIKNADFTHGVRGYKEDEVDIFLDRIAIEMEALMRERDSLKNEIEEIKESVRKQKEDDENVYKTLEAARLLMDDISESAEKRAAILLKNAELNAEAIRREATENVDALTAQAERLRAGLDDMRRRYVSMLENEIRRFESDTSGFLYDLEAMSSGSDGARTAAGAAVRGTRTMSADRTITPSSSADYRPGSKAARYTSVMSRDEEVEEIKSLGDLIK